MGWPARGWKSALQTANAKRRPHLEGKVMPELAAKLLACGMPPVMWLKTHVSVSA